MTSGLKVAACALLDLFYPPSCCACGRSVENADIVLCRSCLEGIITLSEGCPRCGSPLEGKEGECICCSRLDPELELVRSVAWFMGAVPELIHRFKYQGLYRLAVFIAEFMVSHPASSEVLAPAEVLVPVPLHRWRKLRRGYNQSEKIAQELTALSGKELACDSLVRVRRTRSQTRLTPRERKLNVSGAFKVKEPAKFTGRTVLLIDDVMTTGATLSACAVSLKKAGAKRILAYTFARA